MFAAKPATNEKTLQLFLNANAILSWSDIPNRQLQEFLPAVPEQLAGSRVSVHKPAAVAEEQNRVEGVFKDSLEALPVLLKHRLHVLALRDVLSQAINSH